MGNINIFRVYSFPAPVHPHACGEHAPQFAEISCVFGSSPRLWGTFEGAKPDPSISRFIPTPVGNIATVKASTRYSSVHPHACGEHSAANSSSVIVSGSSPRLWGTSRRSDCIDLSVRFIPTPVGNISLSTSPRSPSAVHPHACGEHRPHYSAPSPSSGSSPRLWGTSAPLFGTIPVERFIPTPVGNMVCISSVKIWSPVHPHACGEHEERIRPGRVDFGSSPRLWGT